MANTYLKYRVSVGVSVGGCLTGTQVLYIIYNDGHTSIFHVRTGEISKRRYSITLSSPVQALRRLTAPGRR